jgi:hypothetical protein
MAERRPDEERTEARELDDEEVGGVSAGAFPTAVNVVLDEHGCGVQQRS